MTARSTGSPPPPVHLIRSKRSRRRRPLRRICGKTATGRTAPRRLLKKAPNPGLEPERSASFRSPAPKGRGAFVISTHDFTSGYVRGVRSSSYEQRSSNPPKQRPHPWPHFADCGVRDRTGDR